ncbi:glycosyltransferase [Ligilactobacillus saerimneri]|uniref:glycosyltransferase n=1 Tax=Ligilactobacillus saerimneri TaxID=228229 RepID=UPI002432084B|nr:glycosyltransferase [Ligilactobacillus saerimneri]
MKLLFIQGGSRWKFDAEGSVYTDSNFNNNVWKRYLDLSDDLKVILRQEDVIYPVEEAKKKFNSFDVSLMNYVALPDIYRPFWQTANISKRREIIRTIKNEVKLADAVIIRSLGNIYTNTALKYAQKYKKKYLVEVTGFAKESLWYHSFHGKLVAHYKEHQYKKLMNTVPYAVYVTDDALQKRYPCKIEALGCSDVELSPQSISHLEDRINKYLKKSPKVILGTAAFLDVEWKGQKNVLKAIAYLKSKGIDKFVYQLIGAGSGKQLMSLAKQLGIEDNIQILGSLPHTKVNDWLKKIDIYIQPSYMEGLCRSIVEAMNMACPVVCSNVGGNYELVTTSRLYPAKDYKKLAEILMNMDDTSTLIDDARRNFKKAKEFEKSVLDEKRYRFYNKILEIC